MGRPVLDRMPDEFFDVVSAGMRMPGRRAAELMSHARLEVVPGHHAPFLDDPARCAAIVEEAGPRG